MTSTKQRVAVALSGGGRSLRNLIDQQHDSHYDICAVIASRADCGGVAIARSAHLPLFIADFSPAQAAKSAAAMYQWLEKDIGAKWLALAGFLKHLPVTQAWHHRVINIHPALLPKFGGKGMYGLHVHRAVKEAKVELTGATIHFVSDVYDAGAIIAQKRVLITPHDTPDDIAARVFAAECELYPKTLNDLILGKLPLSEGQIKIYE